MISIQQLKPHESAAYRLLRLESLMLCPDLFSATYADAAALKTMPFERFIQTRDVDNVMFGAFLHGRLSGICGLQREVGSKSRHRAKLVQLYVAERALNRGIGSRLIDAVLHYGFDGLMLEKIELGVVAHNSSAIRLYERRGFREFGRMEGYFSLDGISTTQLFMVYHSQSYEQTLVSKNSLMQTHEHAHANAGAE